MNFNKKIPWTVAYGIGLQGIEAGHSSNIRFKWTVMLSLVALL